MPVQICPRLRTTGVCHEQGCEYRHDVRVCVPCGVVCINTTAYNGHIRGKKHRSRTNSGRRVFHCSVCTKNVPEYQWDAHVEGKRHIGEAARKDVPWDVEPEEAVLKAHEKLCAVCDRIIPLNSWSAHVGGAPHRKMKEFIAYRAAFEEAERNKHGINVSYEEEGIDFGIVEPQEALVGVRLRFSVRNTSPHARIQIVEIRFSSQLTNYRSNFTAERDGWSGNLQYARDNDIVVEFTQQNLGQYEDRLELVFEDDTLHKRFAIVRSVRAIVGSREDHEQLKPRAPYRPRKRSARDEEREVIPGPPPAATQVIKWATKLPGADVPKSLAKILVGGEPTYEVATTLRMTVLPRYLNSHTYARHFQNLLWTEEFRMQHDLEMYDIPDARLVKHGVYYHLEVPGLAENRPSVVIGDRILVQRHGSAKGQWFEGHVHFVRLLEVGLRFHESFHGHTSSARYNVRFKLNRLPLRRQHEALRTAFAPERLLFPTAKHITQEKYQINSELEDWIYNKLVAANSQQLQAIASITQLPPGSPPFVVFGPPGTGKTVTIVEAIRQLVRINPSARIIACAPSNSAADLIASRLSVLGQDNVFRLYAPSRDKKSVPSELLDYTYLARSPEGLDLFSVPPLARLRRFRVVVCTCVSASVLHGVGLPRGHFSHVFIDEAGQATEPEAMVSIKTLSDNNTNVILSGDPKQLGPIIRSAVARELDFELSYLERLMKMAIYDERKWFGRTVVKLVKNFRSHEHILYFPNDKFYRGELKPWGDERITRFYVGWPHLPNPNFPIIFHAISGEDQREASSPSFFNISEVTQVKKYVQMLRDDRRFRITNNDIGIIAPYQAQCGRIRRALRDFEGIKVGSVEEFQGQERRVIIISTVRSSKEFVEYDVKHTLGFVASPRRFNVAMTRAQALLIIVGDPSVLSLDPLWRSFLNHVYHNYGWKGDGPNWDTRVPVREAGGYDRELAESARQDMNEFTRRMASLTLGDLVPQLEDDDVDANEDRPWREME
ncbi:P-loop containing nucleoside triphosphate hydrolase protein [Panus rudis PR-1116 ss-1]|nr:P-loop containing nucleoside triphosphate hydrolase protein [Panus rudis PR-1116 ss-1]